MVEIHCDAKGCHWTYDSEDIEILKNAALRHHTEKGVEPCVGGEMHRHTDFIATNGGEVIVTCQSETVIYAKDVTERPPRRPNDISE